MNKPIEKTRRKLLHAGWAIPAVTAVTLPTHAQASVVPTTTAAPKPTEAPTTTAAPRPTEAPTTTAAPTTTVALPTAGPTGEGDPNGQFTGEKDGSTYFDTVGGDVYVFDAATGTWVKLVKAVNGEGTGDPNGQFSPVANAKGGYDPYTNSDGEVYTFDPATGVWTCVKSCL